MSPPTVALRARTVLGDVGSMLLLPAVLALTAVAVALGAGEHYAVPGFLGTAAAAGAAGLALRRVSGPSRAGSTLQSMATVALGWLVVAAVAAVPFYLTARSGADVRSGEVFADPWSALFEGMSGFTSTGLTMVDAESDLPRTLQWWRSVLEWSGGAGVVVFVLAVTAGSSEGGYRLYQAEGRDRLLREHATATARRIWRLLLGLTAASILALLAAGAEPWVAVNHGLTGISTGGMVITDDSFTGTPARERLVALVIMVAGAVSYGAFGLLQRGDLRAFLRLTQVRLLAAGLVVGMLVTLATLRLLGPWQGWLDTVFVWVSALTTSGFTTVTVSDLPTATVLVLLLGMFVGGSAGSTSGGLKLQRVAWLGKALVRSPRLLDDTSEVRRPWRFDGQRQDSDEAAGEVVSAGALAAAYLLALGTGSVLLSVSAPSASLRDVVFEVLSALNTVGLTSGLTSPDLPWHAKAELIALMWTGRLEVVAVAVFVGAPLLAALRRSAGRAGD